MAAMAKIRLRNNAVADIRGMVIYPNSKTYLLAQSTFPQMVPGENLNCKALWYRARSNPAAERAAIILKKPVFRSEKSSPYQKSWGYIKER